MFSQKKAAEGPGFGWTRPNWPSKTRMAEDVSQGFPPSRASFGTPSGRE
jgi:hypothetical protein